MQINANSKNISLYYREGSSDKIYQASIEASGSGFVVNFAFGRRGSTLNTGTKTATPVSHAEAVKIFDKLVKEKTAKGYTPGEDGTPYQHTDNADRATGIVPQLLNSIDELEAGKYLTDDRWWIQEKFDGRRVLIRKQGDIVTAINRSGLTTNLPLPIVEAVRLLSAAECLLDGEAVGDVYHAFDLLLHDGADIKASPYAQRHALMMNLADGVESDALRFAEAVSGTKQKRAMLERLKRDKKEGAVFKDSSAHYAPGRPASGGTQFKLKFTATASCIVAGVSGNKRSVALQLLDTGGSRVSVGNVTIPPRTKIPDAETIVEIRYLYAYSGGSLYQPVYLGPRDDVGMDACTTAQLKLKSSGEEEA